MDIGDYYSRSINDFRENLVVMIPQLVGYVLLILIAFVGTFIFILGLGPSLFGGTTNPNDLTSLFTLTNILIMGMAFLIYILISLFISSFVGAATIGMSKTIIETGRTSLDTAMEYGKKYFIRIFLMGIIEFVLIFLLALPLFAGITLLSNNPEASFALMIIGILILVIGGIFLGLIFTVVNQSIVVGSKSVIEAIKDSFNVFWDNKLKVFVIALINAVISFAIAFVLSFVPYVGSFLTGIINIALIPYFMLVVTYLYMDIKDMLPDNEEY